MYDLIIIGAGPAGLTASIYASCYHLNHLVIGKELGDNIFSSYLKLITYLHFYLVAYVY